MCEFAAVSRFWQMSAEQQRRFDAHARGEDGTECAACRAKYFDPAFYLVGDTARASEAT
jgi:hypothetical protein